MSIIDATTGHSRHEERNVAKILYIALAVAVILGMVFFFLLGQKPALTPTSPNTPPTTPSEKI